MPLRAKKEAQDRLHGLDRDQIGETENGGGIAAAHDQGRGGLAQVEAALFERTRPQRPQRTGVEQGAVAGETAQRARRPAWNEAGNASRQQGVGPGVARLDNDDLRPAGQGGAGPVPQLRAAVWCATRWLRMKLSLMIAVAEAVEHGLVDIARFDALGRAVVHQARECGTEVLVRQEGIECCPGSRQRVEGTAGQHLAASHCQGLEHQALDVGPTWRCDAGRRGQGMAQGATQHAGIGRDLTRRLTQTRHRLCTAERRSATWRGGRSTVARASSKVARLGASGSRKAPAPVSGGIVMVMR